MRSAESFYQAEVQSGDSGQGFYRPAVKYIDDKTFFYQNGMWIDTAFEPGSMDILKIGFGSQVYFDLIAARPSWGKYLALGDHLIFVAGDMVYEIVEGEGELESLPAQLSHPEEENEVNITEQPANSSGISGFCTAPLLAGLAVLGFGKKK